MNEDQSTKNLLKTTLLQSFSLMFALLNMGAPFWAIILSSAFCFLPYLCLYSSLDITLSLGLSLIEYYLYNILIRPGLYILAIIATISGKQDFFAVIFYIVAGIQLPSIIKNFIGYLLMLFIRH